MLAGQAQEKCLGKGTIPINGLPLKNRMHVSNLNETLIYVGPTGNNEKLVMSSKCEAVILNLSKFSVDESDIIGVANRNQQTRLNKFSSRINSPYSTTVSTDINLWHRCLGHTNVKLLKSLPGYAEDVPKITGKLEPCHACQLGKAKKAF